LLLFLGKKVMFHKSKATILAAITAAATLLGGGQAWAFVTPPSFENSSIDVGTCTGAAVHYEYSANTGIGNAFAILYGGGLSMSHYVNPHFDSGGQLVSQVVDITTLTSADLNTYCGVANATLTVTGVASTAYELEDLIGYTIVGNDPNNGGALTTWEIAVKGVTGTQAVATKKAASVPAVAPVPTLSEWAMVLLSLLLAGAAMVGLRRRS
jgi:IPTL-CTERM motif